MKNADQITQALSILRDTMAPWICRELKNRIPDYQADDHLWWHEAVVDFATRFDDEKYRLGRLTDFAERTDALDISACCSVDLNLDAAQNRETDNNLSRSNQIVEARIQETYCHLLVPYIDREFDIKTIVWDIISIRGGTDGIVLKAAKKMQQNEQLITQWAASLLNMQLENLLWQERNELNIGELWKLLCTYCYLPRLASFEVLQTAIQNGVNSDDYFAYADGVKDGSYIALKYNQYVGFIDKSGYLVKQVAALKQKAAERQEKQNTMTAATWANYPTGQEHYPATQHNQNNGTQRMLTQPEQPKHCHFAMTASLDTTRVVRSVGNLMDEVINHLLQVDGANVEIKL